MHLNAIDAYSMYLFHNGTNYNSYRLFGAHKAVRRKESCVRFAVWAPHAQAVSVVGDFNGWDDSRNPMERADENGIWKTFIPGIREGAVYKYAIRTAAGDTILKADPYAFQAEVRPNTASVVASLNYRWHDARWLKARAAGSSYTGPMNIYEVHAGSWRQHEDGSFLTYRELADALIPYLEEMHYTHVEFMPLCEYPYDGSWGYQATGYFAATSRYGAPEDLMYLIDQCHQHGIGVLLDWVPGHFCRDAHGLRYFDGEPLYESGNPMLAENKDWDTMNFDYGRSEVRSFLISSALFWLKEFHLDGLRIDAVANMLYLDYGRRDGEWQPNRNGGHENLEAVAFLQQLNTAVFAEVPQALMVAEESTSWPLVSRPVHEGGLGFNYKWNMGWMNDMLKYMALDPVYRKGCQDLITFSLYYAFSENFILPLSHDEVVHGKKSLLDKMPGDYWKKFAGLRAFYGYWMSHPGKKLLFMGGEFGQFIEWKYDAGLDWLLLKYPMHAKLQQYVRQLNQYYLDHPEFWQVDYDWKGFEWISCDDCENSVIAFIRHARESDERTIVVCNFTPVVRYNYRIGIDRPGTYREVWNSDDEAFGGSGVASGTRQDGKVLIASEPVPMHGREQSLVLTLPPLAVIYLKQEEPDKGAGTADGAGKAGEVPAAPSRQKAAAARRSGTGRKAAPKKAAPKQKRAAETKAALKADQQDGGK
jgi:1,4-alpha-glucan branching enzyme